MKKVNEVLKKEDFELELEKTNGVRAQLLMQLTQVEIIIQQLERVVKSFKDDDKETE